MNTTIQTVDLTVGTTRFAPNAAGLVASLFARGGTANGTFIFRKNGVFPCKPDGEAFAFLVANPGQSRFFVTVRQQEDGRLRYSFGLSDGDAVRLGISGLGHLATIDEADRVWEQAKAIAEGAS